MKEKWIRMMTSTLALAGAMLSGCGQQGGQQSEYPIVQPTHTPQPAFTATAAPMQRAAPASTAILEPVQASATAAEATASLTPGAPASKGDAMPASKEAVEKAKADLAHKLSVPADEIVLVVVIGQEFTTDGFYCRSSKGRTSKEEPTAMIIGEAILLRAQGSRYEYHANGQEVTFCRKLP